MNREVRNNLFAQYLFALLGLFVFRVIAQLIQAVYPISYLPPFDAWQSGALPYPLLVAFQFVIIFFCLRVIMKIRNNSTERSDKAARIYLTLGGVYLAVMLSLR